MLIATTEHAGVLVIPGFLPSTPAGPALWRSRFSHRVIASRDSGVAISCSLAFHQAWYPIQEIASLRSQ